MPPKPKPTERDRQTPQETHRTDDELTELREAVRGRAKGVKTLAGPPRPRMPERVLLSASRDYDDEPQRLAEIRKTVDAYVRFFYMPCLDGVDTREGRAPEFPTREDLFGSSAFLGLTGGADGADASSWVCDQFIGAAKVSDALAAAADDAVVSVSEDRDRKVTALERKVLRYMRELITSPDDDGLLEWEITAAFLAEEVEWIGTVVDRIRQRQPIDPSDAKRLRDYLRFGHSGVTYDLTPGPEEWFFCFKFYHVLHFDWYAGDPYYPRHTFLAQYLAASAAFQACLELRDLSRSSLRKRFIQRCHSPHCLKSFFTSRRDAKCCERVKGGPVSPCKTAWRSYSDFLRRFPDRGTLDEIWGEPDLIEQYLSGPR